MIRLFQELEGFNFLIIFFISIFFMRVIIYLYFVIASIPVFLSGFVEDLTKKVSALLRLFFTVISSIICIILTKLGINSLGVEIIDNLIANTYIPYFFAFLSMILLTQASNIIDGLNGLCLLNAILIVLSIIYVSHKVDSIFFLIWLGIFYLC